MDNDNQDTPEETDGHEPDIWEIIIDLQTMQEALDRLKGDYSIAVNISYTGEGIPPRPNNDSENDKLFG